MHIDITNLLKKYFKKYKNILAAYIFGSVAKGKQHAKSDLDIAILLEKENKYFDLLKITSELSILLKKDVHLLILNESSYLSRIEVYKSGTLIYTRNPAQEKLIKAKNLMLYLDFQPFAEIHRKRVAGYFKNG